MGAKTGAPQNFFFCERSSKCPFLYQSATVCGVWMGGEGGRLGKNWDQKKLFFCERPSKCPFLCQSATVWSGGRVCCGGDNWAAKSVKYDLPPHRGLPEILENEKSNSVNGFLCQVRVPEYKNRGTKQKEKQNVRLQSKRKWQIVVVSQLWSICRTPPPCREHWTNQQIKTNRL